MQSSSGQQPPRLSAAVSAELARLEAEVRQAADPLARPRLAGLGDAAASRVLRKIWENRRGVKRLSAYIMRMVEKEATESNAAAIPAAESSVPLRSAIQRQEDSVPDPLYCGDVPMEDQSPNDEIHSITSGFQEMVGPSGRVGMATPTSVAASAGDSLRATASPQMLTLGEMEEFDRIFLIPVYLADKKLEEVIQDINYIMYLKSLPMDSFEPEIWSRFGSKYIPASDRRKGPYFDNTRTHLQKVVGDDNVLIVKFADIPELMNSADNFGTYGMFCHQVAEDGILLGLRRSCTTLRTLTRLREPTEPLGTFERGRAIYQVVYERAMVGNEVSKCGFAWKVAGRALCELYLLKHGGERVTCLRSVLEDAFKKYRA